MFVKKLPELRDNLQNNRPKRMYLKNSYKINVLNKKRNVTLKIFCDNQEI